MDASVASAVTVAVAPITTTCSVAVSAAETASELLLAVKLAAKASREVCAFLSPRPCVHTNTTHNTQRHTTTFPRA